jgi:N-sulfoglucosamine sulfohydrolase
MAVSPVGIRPLSGICRERTNADGTVSSCSRPSGSLPLRAVRSERFKYIRRFDDYDRPVLAYCDDSASKKILVEAGWGEQRVPEEQLYDLLFRPSELNDLSADPTRQQILTEYRERLLEWMRAIEDPLLNGRVPEPPGAWSNDPRQASPNDPTSAAER